MSGRSVITASAPEPVDGPQPRAVLACEQVLIHLAFKGQKNG